MDRQQRLSQLQRRFIAANMRSRSIRLTRATRSGALDLHRLQRAAPERFDALLKKLGRASSRPIPIVDVQPSTPDALSCAEDLAVLTRAARADWMETGAQDLAIGWPLLEGRAPDGSWIRGPLLLYPVEASTTDVGKHRWTLQLASFPELNLSLAQALFRLTRVRITLDAILDSDDDRILALDDPTWAGLTLCLASLGLPMTPAPETLPELSALDSRNHGERAKIDLDSFTLHHQMVLGRFPRAGSNIALDYEQLLEAARNGSLGLAEDMLAVDEASLWEETSAPLEDRRETRNPQDGDEGRRWQVLPSDSSQDAVFRFLEQDGSRGLVVQGPPGTGKSQMITNLIAAAIAQDRRTLLVCQKRAALDVVADRLSHTGLREPVAVVHDVQRDRNAVCDALAQTLDRALSGGSPKAEAQQRALLHAERDSDLALSRLGARMQAAQNAFTLLAETHDDRPPLAALQERALDDDLRPLPDLTSTALGASENDSWRLRPRIAALSPDTTALALPHPLAQRTQWADMTPEKREDVLNTVEKGLEQLASLEKGQPHLLPEEARSLEEVWSRASDMLDLVGGGDRDRIDAFLLFWVWTGGETRHGEWSQTMGMLSEARRKLGKVPYELILARRAELESWLASLVRLKTLATKWYRLFLPEHWRLRKLPGQILDRCPSLFAEDPTSALVDHEGLVRRALEWHDFIASMPSDNPALDFGFQGDPQEIDDAIEELRTQHDRVRAVHALFSDLQSRGGPYAEMPDLGPLDDPSEIPFFQAALCDRQRARTLDALRQTLTEMAEHWRPELLTEIEEHACSGETKPAFDRLEAITSSWNDSEEAVRLDTLMREDPEWVQSFLRQWRPPEVGPSDPGEDARLGLERAWRRLALGDRNARQVEAPLVDAGQLKGFGEDVDRRLEVAGRGVLSRYHRRLGESASERGRHKALRKLAGEARKKRRRMTLRQLVEATWDTGLAQARPVWFCSPESVAALFPLRSDLFDLVIFDEASQCPVESAIPTLARGKRAIVAGDDQQMPPSHFFRVTDPEESEDEDSAVMASHSLLALARVAFPDTTLRWHYRSRHEELVAFSNAAFYGKRLITAPRREPIQAPEIEGLHWELVEGGLWQDQRNAIEAERTVEIVARLLGSTSPDGTSPSIGVVTFNRKQAELIEKRIDELAREEPMRSMMARDRQRPAVEQLFVRNLENVQGDERDVIVFSVGYGPSEPGGRIHARFGPLGMEGGEKRLNVAITRARLGVWVVSSFDPDALSVEKSTHVGPKLFKLYLRFVRDSALAQRTSQSALLKRAGELGGGQGVTGTHREASSQDRLGTRVRDALAEGLRARGLRVQVGLGLGSQRLDLAVGIKGESHWRLGVDCSEFLSNPDPLARDVFTVRFWERLGWVVVRVTPSMWLEDRAGVVERLASMVEDRATPPARDTPR